MVRLGGHASYLRRSTSLVALAEISSTLDARAATDDALPAALKLAADPVANVRFAAATCLGVLGRGLGPAARARVDAALDALDADADVDVREFSGKARAALEG